MPGEDGAGMNLEVIRSYIPLFLEAGKLTLRLGLAGIALAIVIGLICAAVSYWHVPVLRILVSAYIEISRNTPLLIQLFFIYYGLPKLGIRTSPAACGIAGLAFLGGSYMAEGFRSGLEAVAPIQLESALSLGMSNRQALVHVILPQALKTVEDPYLSEIIALIKNTSIVGYVAVSDVTRASDIIRGRTYDALFPLIVVAIIYYLTCTLLVTIIRIPLKAYIEMKVKYDDQI